MAVSPNLLPMRNLFLSAFPLFAIVLLAVGQTPEPSYTVSFGVGSTTRATLGVRYSSDGLLDAATVTIARPDSPKRDQSRVTGDDIARAPGVLTPLKLFVTETWEAGANPLDVGEIRKLVLAGFTSKSENVVLERLADDKKTGHRIYLVDGPISHWKIVTDGRRLISLKGEHGVTIQHD
jgi:hypothetical protein